MEWFTEIIFHRNSFLKIKYGGSTMSSCHARVYAGEYVKKEKGDCPRCLGL